MATELSDLAQLLSGDSVDPYDEKGEPIEEEQVEETLEEEIEEEPVEFAEEEEQLEDVEESTLEATDDSEVSEESEVYPETLDDLIEAYDGDAERLKGLTVASKKNGEKVSLGQVLANWEIGEAATRKSQEASELKKSIEKEKAKFHSTMAEKFQEQEAIVQALEELYKNAGAAELEQLRTSNPAEFAARKAEFAERDRMLGQVKDSIADERKKQYEEYQKEMTEKQKEYVESQAGIMLSLIPEWSNMDTFNNDFKDISEYMTTLGFQEKEVAGIVDARLRKIIRDAMLYSKIKTKANPKVKRIVKKPKKVVRAGNTSSGNLKDDAKAKRMKRAAKSDDRRVKQAAIAELLLDNIS